MEKRLTEQQQTAMLAHLRKIITEHTAGRPRPPLPCWYTAMLASGESEKPEKPEKPYTAADARQEREQQETGGGDLIFTEEWER